MAARGRGGDGWRGVRVAGARDGAAVGVGRVGAGGVVLACELRAGRRRDGRRGRAVVLRRGAIASCACVRASVRCPLASAVSPARRVRIARRLRRLARPAGAVARGRDAPPQPPAPRPRARPAPRRRRAAAADDGDRRGQSTTRATIAGSAARRATFPQRTRRSSESGGMDAVGIGRGEFAPCYRAPPLMAAPAPIYDLMVLLDTTAPDDQRAKILADAEAMITSGGSVVSKHDWGPRTMAYEIRHKTDAEYHLIQFHGNAGAAGEPPAHAADHGRRRALPDHQARARHAGPAAEARARAGRAGRSARRGLSRARPTFGRCRATSSRRSRPAAGPFCCQPGPLRDDSATKERRIRRVRGSRRNPGLHSPQQSSDAFAPPRKEPFRAWPRRTSTG